jgi:hypothetical protein
MALGLWLMAAPDVLGTQKPAANSDHLVGALVVVVAVIATAEVTRVVRFLNVPAGAWIVAAPWLLEGASAIASWNSILVGGLVLVLEPTSWPGVREVRRLESVGLLAQSGPLQRGRTAARRVSMPSRNFVGLTRSVST